MPAPELKNLYSLAIEKVVSGRIFTIASLQRATRWLVALSALAGVALIVAWLSDPSPQAAMLAAAVDAVGAAVFFVAASVLMDCLPLTRRDEHCSAPQLLDRGRSERANVAATSFGQRQENLDQRLNIDEPRLCSQSMMPCTMWSLCGSADDAHSAAVQAHAAALPVVVQPGEPALPGGAGMPVVERRNVAGCPYSKTSDGSLLAREH